MTIEEILADVQARLAAIGETVSEDRIKSIVGDHVKSLTEDKEFVRKMRFGSPAEFSGSKFARWGLNAGDVEFLYDLMTSRAKAGLGSGPSEELTRAFSAISEAQYLSPEEIKRIDGRALDELYPRVSKRSIRDLEAAYRAMDTAESGYGSQLVGAQYVADLWTAARNQARVFPLIDTLEMTAPTAYYPVEVDFPEMLLVSESTANNASNYGTSKTGSNRVTLTAKKFVIHQMWSGEMEEDSIIPFVPFLRRQLAESLSFYSDSLVLNGDDTNAATGNINLDDADPADTKHYLAFDGIRHAALVDNTNNALDVAGAVTFNHFRTLKGYLVDQTYYHDWGHPTNPEDLTFIADVETADRIATLDEVLSSKIQRSRALLNGEVADIMGHPVIGAIALRKTEADGKLSTTAANNTKGQLVGFNRRGYKIGWRRTIKLETERLPATDQTRIVASLRMALGRFTPTGAASGIEHTAVAYDISL